MLKLYKQYVQDYFKNKNVRFVCDCIFNINIKGQIVDTEIVNNEIIFILFIDNKKIQIGENTPNLKIEIL